MLGALWVRGLAVNGGAGGAKEGKMAGRHVHRSSRFAVCCDRGHCGQGGVEDGERRGIVGAGMRRDRFFVFRS